MKIGLVVLKTGLVVLKIELVVLKTELLMDLNGLVDIQTGLVDFLTGFNCTIYLVNFRCHHYLQKSFVSGIQYQVTSINPTNKRTVPSSKLVIGHFIFDMKPATQINHKSLRYLMIDSQHFCQL